jgi:lysophospholipase L1-like esterase
MKLKIVLIPLLIACFTPLFIYSQNESMNKDWANLKKYNSENFEVMTSFPNSKKVVLMGDSITEFWKINDPDFFSQTIINRGISGQTTPQMVLRFRQDVVNLKPTAVVILAGINDIAENTGPISNEGILDNIISMAELAKANKIKVVLCSVVPANKFNWNPTILPAERVIQLNQLIKNYASKNGITYVDYYSAMVDSEKGLQKKYGEDGVHPNLEGYLVMKSILNKALETVLK